MEGYPNDYDSMCFGSAVDEVKFRLKESLERSESPRTMAELLAIIESVLKGCGEDTRFPL